MNPSKSDKLAEVDALASRLLDGRLDEASHARLNALLYGDPEAAERYLNLITLHAHLRRGSVVLPGDWTMAGLPDDATAATAAFAWPADRSTSLGPVRRWFSTGWVRNAAAALLLIGMGVLVSRWMPTESGTVAVAPPASDAATQPAVATVAEVADLDGQASALVAGRRVGVGPVSLAAGTARLRFDNGAVLTLYGPAEADLRSGKLVELRSGRASVRCPPEAVGFTVRTPASDFVDLGTEFGVAVNQDQSADIHVFEGVVIARPKASGLVVPVLNAESGRVAVERGDLTAIDPEPGRFPGVETKRPSSRPVAASSDPAATGVVHKPLPADARVIFLGDRATDRETHLLLINQALRRAYPEAAARPSLFNAGHTFPLFSDAAAFESMVMAFRPTHAVLEFGPEIASSARPAPVERYEAALDRLLDRLKSAGVDVVLCTGFPLGPMRASEQPTVDQYNAVVRRLAAERGLRLADVDGRFRHAAEAGQTDLVSDAGVVPTFAGSREMAAEVLAALGHETLPIDPTLDLVMLPGVVAEWHVRFKSQSDRLTAAAAAEIEPTDGWRLVRLPQRPDPFLERLANSSHSVTYRDRMRGFATDLYGGQGRMLEGVAFVDSESEKRVYLNTGATLTAAYLNGQLVWKGEGWSGWHAGRQRVPVTLKPGRNKLVIEANGSFFVSLTDRFDWPLP